MTDVTLGAALAVPETAPAMKIRGYWGTVGYRLRYDYVTLFFVFLNLIVDIVQASIDPRIKRS